MPWRSSFEVEHVDALVVDAEVVEDLHDLAGEPALREAGRALHEEHDVVALHFVVDVVVDTAHVIFPIFAVGSRRSTKFVVRISHSGTLV